jgi:hypothetical protein
VILLGQPELRDRLDRPEMEHFAQRVRLRYHIRAFSEQETGAYVRHRLEVAGAAHELFPGDVMSTVFHYTGGIPRLINVLSDTALVCAYADGVQSVTPNVMEAAIKELGWVTYAVRKERNEIVDSGGIQNLRRGAPVLSLSTQECSTLVSTLQDMVDRLGKIEASLNVIASRMSGNESSPVVPFARNSR